MSFLLLLKYRVEEQRKFSNLMYAINMTSTRVSFGLCISADKEAYVRSDDYGRDLSSVQTLLTKQVTFAVSLALAGDVIMSVCTGKHLTFSSIKK
jgi:hypothetical protein